MHSSSASSPAPDPASEPDPAPAPAPATASQPSKMAKPFGYGYPTLQPGYQNAAAPLNSGTHPSSPAYSGFQQYPQVCVLSCEDMVFLKIVKPILTNS
jgi:protein transport protein SEC24